MAGFFSVALNGEHFGVEIVNVLHYRSTEWLPWQGNPFDDVLATLDAVLGRVQAPFLQCQVQDYTLLSATAVGYDDGMHAVTSSPLVRDIGVVGSRGIHACSGSFLAACVSARCGEQHSIRGSLKSKRNRGYITVGPLSEDVVDDWGHLLHAYVEQGLTPFAQALMSSIVMLAPAVTLIPIRLHHIPVKVAGVQVGTDITYSDILGYTLPRRATVRRSRMQEA